MIFQSEFYKLNIQSENHTEVGIHFYFIFHVFCLPSYLKNDGEAMGQKDNALEKAAKRATQS